MDILGTVFVLASESANGCAEKVSSRIHSVTATTSSLPTSISTSDLMSKLTERLNNALFPTKSVDSLNDTCADDDSFVPSGKGTSTDVSVSISDDVSMVESSHHDDNNESETTTVDLNHGVPLHSSLANSQIPLGQEIASTSISMLRIFLGIDDDFQNTFGLNWAEVAVRDKVTCRSSTVTGNAWNAVSCSTRIDADKTTIFDLLFDDSRAPEFDDMFDFITPLVKVDQHTAIRRVCCKPIWPTAPRDLLVCTTKAEVGDGSEIICSRFAPDEILGKQKGYVRAIILISGYWIQPLACLSRNDPLYDEGNDRACKLTLAIHSDLGGYLPASLMNYVTTDTPLKTMSLIRQVAQKDFQKRP